MTNLEIINKASAELKGISSQPLIESQWILSSILKKPLSDIYQNFLSKDQKEIFLKKVKERKKGWPLAYVLKEVYFFDYAFYIEPGVFIPRPESEKIIQEVLDLNLSHVKAIDFGAGSGSLCLTLLKKIPQSQFIAVEISSPSLKCLKINRKTFNLEERLHILNIDVSSVKLDDAKVFLKEKPNLIVSNPPYVRPQDKNLQKEVRDFEPPLSLFSSEEGMSHVYTWFYKAMELLTINGVYCFEFGYDQGEKVRQFLDKESCTYKIVKDEQGLERIAVCQKGHL